MLLFVFLLSILCQISPVPTPFDTQPYFLGTLAICYCFNSALFAGFRSVALPFLMILLIPVISSTLLFNIIEQVPNNLSLVLKNLFTLLTISVSPLFYKYLIYDTGYAFLKRLIRLTSLGIFVISFSQGVVRIFPGLSHLFLLIVPNSRSLGDRLAAQLSRGTGSGGLFNEPSFATYAITACILCLFLASTRMRSLTHGSFSFIAEIGAPRLILLVSSLLLAFTTPSGALLVVVFFFLLSFFIAFAFESIYHLKVSLKVFVFLVILCAVTLVSYLFLSHLAGRMYSLASSFFDVGFSAFIQDRSALFRFTQLSVFVISLLRYPFGFGLNGYEVAHGEVLSQGFLSNLPYATGDSVAFLLPFVFILSGWIGFASYITLYMRMHSFESVMNVLRSPLGCFALLMLLSAPLTPAWPFAGLFVLTVRSSALGSV